MAVTPSFLGTLAVGAAALVASFVVLDTVDVAVQRLAVGGSTAGIGRGEGITLLLLYLVFIAGRLLLFAGQ